METRYGPCKKGSSREGSLRKKGRQEGRREEKRKEIIRIGILSVHYFLRETTVENSSSQQVSPWHGERDLSPNILIEGLSWFSIREDSCDGDDNNAGYSEGCFGLLNGRTEESGKTGCRVHILHDTGATTYLYSKNPFELRKIKEEKIWLNLDRYS